MYNARQRLSYILTRLLLLLGCFCPLLWLTCRVRNRFYHVEEKDADKDDSHKCKHSNYGNLHRGSATFSCVSSMI